mmetsp:Transcript_16438/g.32134  ORF Transcript_16438/g.32134 Transcript_16438/m.32134 type:complete len:201 (-) Transcript_16438:287-889(-)
MNGHPASPNCPYRCFGHLGCHHNKYGHRAKPLCPQGPCYRTSIGRGTSGRQPRSSCPGRASGRARTRPHKCSHSPSVAHPSQTSRHHGNCHGRSCCQPSVRCLGRAARQRPTGHCRLNHKLRCECLCPIADHAEIGQHSRCRPASAGPLRHAGLCLARNPHNLLRLASHHSLLQSKPQEPTSGQVLQMKLSWHHWERWRL